MSNAYKYRPQYVQNTLGPNGKEKTVAQKLTALGCFRKAEELSKEMLDYDSRDVGRILTMAICTLLVNAPTRNDFDEYKSAAIGSINSLKWPAE